jgi:uncharacterized surface protein with fasciclin (FAS1) repeats
MKYSLTAITMLGLFVGGPVNAMNSNVENALAGQGDLSVFHQALLTTGVANELNESTDYTIFAPTNEAFAAIQVSTYPCFYSVQCRTQVAEVLRNHIVPVNESVNRFSKWGGGIPTIGTHSLNVEEPYAGQYTAEGHRVLDQSKASEKLRLEGNSVSLYRIDGVIASDEEMTSFRSQPLAGLSTGVTQQTVTTYSTPTVYPVVYDETMAPGGHRIVPLAVTPDGLPADANETTTVTHTTITE